MLPPQSVNWETHPELFDALDTEFGPFTCDPAAVYLGGGHVAEVISSLVDSLLLWSLGLENTWKGRVFLNPPYGREMPRWIEKAVLEVQQGNCERVVALLPARTDTRMWQQYILRDIDTGIRHIGAHGLLRIVRFLPGRLRFVGATASAPFPSA